MNIRYIIFERILCHLFKVMLIRIENVFQCSSVLSSFTHEHVRIGVRLWSSKRTYVHRQELQVWDVAGGCLECSFIPNSLQLRLWGPQGRRTGAIPPERSLLPRQRSFVVNALLGDDDDGKLQWAPTIDSNNRLSFFARDYTILLLFFLFSCAGWIHE